jgi:phosphoglycolate phosphatase-like HAD superfamily hydrolase
MKLIWSKEDLVGLSPRHTLLAAVDSDGCVFDSMTIKQRIFHTGILRTWGLEHCEAEFRRVAEWTALFSPWRGLNRFELLLQIFRNLDKAQPFFPTIGKAPDFSALEAFVLSGVPRSVGELAKRVDATGDPELARILDWSRTVSREIAAVAELPVFPGAVQGLKALRAVSQTAEEALVREWRNADLDGLVEVIAGAELGSKAESLRTAMAGRYGTEQTVMIGDAPGDLEAARAVGCLFFPILPGAEATSWEELQTEGLVRLRQGRFAGAYQQELLTRFRAVLSDVPSWSS